MFSENSMPISRQKSTPPLPNLSGGCASLHSAPVKCIPPETAKQSGHGTARRSGICLSAACEIAPVIDTVNVHHVGRIIVPRYYLTADRADDAVSDFSALRAFSAAVNLTCILIKEFFGVLFHFFRLFSERLYCCSAKLSRFAFSVSQTQVKEPKM